MSSIKCRLLVAQLFVLSIFGSCHAVYGEWLYHQPYFGLKQVVPLANGPLPGLRAEKILDDNSPDLGRLAKNADLIFIGINGAPQKFGLPDTQQVEYEADVRLYDFVKWKPSHRFLKFLRLRWKSSATELGAMERHLFFVREDVGADGKTAYHVLRAAFMTPDSRNKVQLFDHSRSFHTDLTLKVLGVRQYGGAPKGFADQMAKTIAGYPKQMPLLTELPVEFARPGWRQALRSFVSYRSDLAPFAVVANDIISRGSDEDILALLKRADFFQYDGRDGQFKPRVNSLNRTAEFMIYDLFRHHGNDRIVRLLIRHGDLSTKKKAANILGTHHSTAIVSVAFVLAEIGGKDARQAIERWKKDETIANKTVFIAMSLGHSVEVKNGDLFGKALERLDEKHSVKPDSPQTNR